MKFKNLLKAFRPFEFSSLLFMYALGGGLGQYLQGGWRWADFITGGLFLLFWFLMINLVSRLMLKPVPENWPEFKDLKILKQTRWLIAMVAATLSIMPVIILISWMVDEVLWLGGWMVILLVIVLSFFYLLFQHQEKLSPYTVLLEVLMVVILPPAFAFFIHNASFHPLLTLVVMGFVPLFLAFRLLGQLKRFAQDQMHDRVTLVTLIGWQKAMVFHNALILAGFLLFSLVGVWGLPWFLLWPLFLVLPIGCLEIWLMERVRRGGKPLWKIMTFATGAVFFLPLYLLGFTFWIR